MLPQQLGGNVDSPPSSQLYLIKLWLPSLVSLSTYFLLVHDRSHSSVVEPLCPLILYSLIGTPRNPVSYQPSPDIGPLALQIRRTNNPLTNYSLIGSPRHPISYQPSPDIGPLAVQIRRTNKP